MYIYFHCKRLERILTNLRIGTDKINGHRDLGTVAKLCCSDRRVSEHIRLRLYTIKIKNK